MGTKLGTVEERAARGAELLDQVWPGWHRKVRITRLAMENGVINPEGESYLEDRCGCVLAQLDLAETDVDWSGHPRGWYQKGLNRLWERAGRRVSAVSHGFVSRDGFASDGWWERLTEAWKAEIRARR